MQQSEFAGKVTLDTPGKVAEFLASINPLPPRKTRSNSQGSYIIDTTDMKPERLFDAIEAWRIKRVDKPFTIMQNGELVGQIMLGDYGYYLTTNGYILKRHTSFDKKHSSLYKKAYESLINGKQFTS